MSSENQTLVTPYKGIPLESVPKNVLHHWSNYQKGFFTVQNTQPLIYKFQKWGFLPKVRKQRSATPEQEQKRNLRRDYLKKWYIERKQKEKQVLQVEQCNISVS
jgi:hypothetical protein